MGFILTPIPSPNLYLSFSQQGNEKGFNLTNRNP